MPEKEYMITVKMRRQLYKPGGAFLMDRTYLPKGEFEIKEIIWRVKSRAKILDRHPLGHHRSSSVSFYTHEAPGEARDLPNQIRTRCFEAPVAWSNESPSESDVSGVLVCWGSPLSYWHMGKCGVADDDRDRDREAQIRMKSSGFLADDYEGRGHKS
jgi:hypothetical protein